MFRTVSYCYFDGLFWKMGAWKETEPVGALLCSVLLRKCNLSKDCAALHCSVHCISQQISDLPGFSPQTTDLVKFDS